MWCNPRGFNCVQLVNFSMMWKEKHIGYENNKSRLSWQMLDNHLQTTIHLGSTWKIDRNSIVSDEFESLIVRVLASKNRICNFQIWKSCYITHSVTTSAAYSIFFIGWCGGLSPYLAHGSGYDTGLKDLFCLNQKFKLIVKLHIYISLYIMPNNCFN